MINRTRLGDIRRAVANEATERKQASASQRSEIVKEATIIATAGIERVKAQVGIGSGGYSGSGYSSGGAKYSGGLGGSGSLFLNHDLIRRQARLAYFDTPQAKSIVDRFADTVADTGLRLDPAPMAGILGLSQVEVEAWADNVSQRFDLFARDKKQHRSGTMTFYQTHRLYHIFQQRDNDMFVRLFYSKDRSLINRLQFEFVDPGQITGSGFTSTATPLFNVVDGIERDSQGREKAYHVWIVNTQGQLKIVRIPAVGRRSGRINMLHGFSQEYAGQQRGYSRLAHALEDFSKLTDFSLAHIIKAINESSLLMYVKPSQDAPASNPLEDLISNRGAGPAGSGATTAGVSCTGDAFKTNVNFCAAPEAEFPKPGATVIANLEGGEELKMLGASAPSDSFDGFVNAFTSHLAASMSMPLEALLMKFNANYSASRATLILFWRVAVIWREEMAADYLNPIYEMWLSEEIAAGRIAAAGFTDPVLRRAWLRANWIGVPMPNIDPKRTADADRLYAEMGVTTLERIARKENGSDAKTNRARITKEFAEIPPSPWSINPQSQSENDENDDDEKDDKENG